MLESFVVSHKTDGKTICRIYVEVSAKRCSITISVDMLIIRQADETDPSFRSITPAAWSDVAFWEGKAAELAKAYSPFWRGDTAA